MIRRGYKKQEPKKFYRINERIQAFEVRVLDNIGQQIGVMSRQEALQRAKDEELDLVEIAATAKPPVVKIIDFKKFLYQESKKKQEEKKRAKPSETKEVRLGPFMGTHDLDVMVSRAKGFLEDGDKVRLVVRFTGRQMAHPEIGRGVLQKVIATLEDISKIEREPRMEGRQLITILSPDKKHAKEKNQTISQETL